jgi:hypothetical protein
VAALLYRERMMEEGVRRAGEEKVRSPGRNSPQSSPNPLSTCWSRVGRRWNGRGNEWMRKRKREGEEEKRGSDIYS